MGVVYKALDTTLDRHVAIKFLPPHLHSDPQAKTRFVHEAKAASALNHANIAVVHEIDETPEDQMFIVMAYYGGGSLRPRLKNGALGVDEAARIISQLASGLGKAHEKRILHRDIKPENILMGSDGHAKLADFGLAKLAGRTQVTRTGATLGTVSYMSPEQARGDAIDNRSDIFSLGVVLYELLTGKRPFTGGHDAAVLHGIMNEDPAPLAAHRSDLPPELQGIVNRALCKDPEGRYQTAAEFLYDMQALGGDKTISVYQPGRRRRSPNRVAMILATLALLGAAGITGFLWFRGTPGTTLSPGADETLVIAVAPFWGPNAEAREEGKVMQALVERRLVEELGDEASISILGKSEFMEAPQSDGGAKELGEELGATIVLWGEVLVLRGEVEIQPYLTYVKWFRGAAELIPEGMQASLDGPNQLTLRKAKARDVGAMALMMAGAFFHKEDPDRSLTILRKIDPPTAQSLFHQGVILREKGAVAEAEKVILEAHELFPNDPIASLGLGRIHRWRGDLDTAISWYKNAIEIDPDFQDAYASVSIALKLQGKFEEAVRWLQAALERFPGEYWAYVNMAALYADQKQNDVARSWVEESIAHADNPTQLGNSYVFIGALHRLQGEDDEGLRWYKKAIECDPYQWRPYMNIGNIHFDKERYEAAADWYARGAEQTWGGVDIQYPVSLIMLGRYEEAASALHILMEMNPKNFYHPIMYSICLHLLGRGEEAAEYLSPSPELSTDDGWVSHVLRYFAGQITEGEVFDSAKSGDPDQIRRQKCEAYYYLGMDRLVGVRNNAEPDTTTARDYFEKCLATGESNLFEFKLAGRILGTL